ncbi:MAG: hypothetical protein V3V14_00690 [Saprospiraceae bacterium]
MQFAPKGMLHYLSDDLPAYYKLQEIRLKLYPYDFEPYSILQGIYDANYGADSTKALMKKAIKNGNVEKGLLSLYEIYLNNEEYDEAEKTLDNLFKEFPNRAQDKFKYATIYEKQGRLLEAKELLLDEEIINPLSSKIQTRLSYIEFKNLEITKALDRLENGIQQSSTLVDTLNYMWIKTYFLQLTGQNTKALETIKSYEKHAIKLSPVNRVIMTTFTMKNDIFQSVGQTSRIAASLEEIKKYSPMDAKNYHCWINSSALKLGYQMTMNLEDYKLCSESYKTYGEGFVKYFEVLKLYADGNYKECISNIEDDEGKLKKTINDNLFISKMYQKVGDIKTAKKILQNAIDKKPDKPIYYLQMALLVEKENQVAAKKYLDVALQFWTNSDADFIPLQKANALKQRL